LGAAVTTPHDGDFQTDGRDSQDTASYSDLYDVDYVVGTPPTHTNGKTKRRRLSSTGSADTDAAVDGKSEHNGGPVEVGWEGFRRIRDRAADPELAEIKPIRRFIKKLERAGRDPQPKGDGWEALCPAHDDHHPSLVIGEGIDGRVLIHCRAGCDSAHIVNALGLMWRDLFPPLGSRTSGATFDASEIVDTYDYVDKDGEVVFQAVRLTPDPKTGKKRFRQRRPNPDGDGWIDNLDGVRLVLYNLPEVLVAIKDGRTIWIPEGEKDVESLRAIGEVGTCNPMGAGKGKWRPEFGACLKGAAQVNIVADKDLAGYPHAQRVYADVRQYVDDLWIVEAAEGKDITDHLEAGLSLDELIDWDGDSPPEEEEQEDDYGEAGSWTPIDLTDVVIGLQTGSLERPKPMIGVCSNGRALFYPRRINEVHSVSGDGKSWLALFATAQEIAKGNHVVFIDYEDDEIGIVGRLLDIGTDPDVILRCFHYFHPQDGYDSAAHSLMTKLISRHPVTLAVVDSEGESLSMEGKKSNVDEDIATWGQLLVRPLAALGPAVLDLDHVTKDKNGRLLYSIGSQRKRALINGASYYIEPIPDSLMGKGRVGMVKLVCSKDRGGHYAQRQEIAMLRLDATTEPYTISLDAFTSDAVKGQLTLAEKQKMQAISEFVEANPDVTRNAIYEVVKGKKDTFEKLMDYLIPDYIQVSEDGQDHHHRVVKPYMVEEAEPPRTEREPTFSDMDSEEDEN
jgi:hypothetical protein